MVSWSDLPTVNAGLNAVSAVLLTAGFGFVRAKRIQAHRACMLAACATSTLFLISYLAYHAHAGATRFSGTGWVRGLYVAILGSHTILAVVVVPLALRTLWLAWRDRVPEHRRLARVTLPIWLYVSVTGVVVYGMLYHL